MSYPRQLRPLVIEDDPKVKGYYEKMFAELQAKKLPVLDPRFAFSLEDAVVELGRDRAYHLVILDLCLPERTGIPANEGDVTCGQSLLADCITRDDFPIPALLVITGYASKTDQSAFRTTLKAEFAYGELVVKGEDLLQEVQRAIERVLAYLDVGIHLRDGGTDEWPTISPREDDLIRRAVLERQDAGVDLAWWSARRSSYSGWTKTLVGRFLLGQGRGSSRINFFKLVCGGADAGLMDQDVRVLESKLSHVKRTAFVTARSRSLLITEKTGDGDGPPESLDRYLSRPSIEALSHVPALAQEVVRQLRSLGDVGVQMRRPRELLWRCHDRGRLVSARERHVLAVSNGLGDLTADAIATFDALQAVDGAIRYEERDCTHGDMNVTNVAVDRSQTGGLVPRAYVFDAAGVGKGPDLRDLASLEVSALLHLPVDVDLSIVEVCGPVLYGAMLEVPDAAVVRPDRAMNTLAWIRAVRSQVSTPGTYALAVFDQALVQLGGLVQQSGNRVRRFGDAVLLADMAAGWLRRVAGSPLGPA